jgi:hypothetical protein
MVPSRTIFLAALVTSIGGCQDSRPAPAGRSETRPTDSRAAATRPALTESAKIELLLDAITKSSGAKFIRNGAEHDGKAAADHLRSKWRSAASDIKTAKDFIEKLATTSSMSGKPYEVKLPDGSKVKLRDWLTERLSELK